MCSSTDCWVGLGRRLWDGWDGDVTGTGRLHIALLACITLKREHVGWWVGRTWVILVCV